MKLPVNYPHDDHIKYLDFFRPNFTRVFVAFNQFIRADGVPHQDHRCYLNDEIRAAIGRQGVQTCVSWTEIAALSGFHTTKRINRALRLTGSKRIRAELSSQPDTETLLQVCKLGDISLPDEGCFTPGMTLKVAHFLRAIGYSQIWSAAHFDDDARFADTHSLEGHEYRCPAQLYGPDDGFYITTFTDYHYALVCQTEASRRKANPADFFEGFDADESTDDYWGIGVNADD